MEWGLCHPWWVLRPVPLSAVDAVSRGLVSAALVWQLLWFVSLPVLWPQEQDHVLVGAAILLTFVTWMALLIVHVVLPGRSSRALSTADGSALVLAALSLGLVAALSAAPDWHAVAELTALAAGVNGLLLGRRAGIVVTIGLAALLVLGVWHPGADGIAPTLSDGLLDPAYVLAVGLSAAAARHALLKSAAAADLAGASLLEAESRRRAAESVEASLRATERLLHEQVLNTLVAIARGGLGPSSSALLRERCAEGARLLRSLRMWGSGLVAPTWSTSDVLEGIEPVVRDLQAAGVRVEVDIDDLGLVPEPVRVALRVALRESLSNVLRHADAHHVSVVGRVTGGRRATQVDMRVTDDGCGLGREPAIFGFGVRDAILGPMVEAGGTAEVRDAAEGGVTVLLSWRTSSASQSADADILVPRPSALSVPVLAALSLYVAAMVIVTWSAAQRPGWNVAAVALWSLAALAVAIRTTRGHLTWWWVAPVAVLGWATYAAQEAAFSTGEGVGWASPAIAALFLVGAATGPMWGWVLLLGAWLAFQGDPLHELTQPGTVMILVGAILGRSLRGNGQRAWQRRSEEAAASAADGAARERVTRLATRYAGLDASQAIELLERIATSTVVADDPGLREAAVREERYLRNILVTDPAIDDLHATVSELVTIAHDLGVLLDVSLAPGLADGHGAPADSVAGFARALRHALPSRIVDGRSVTPTAQVTTLQEGEMLLLRMIVPLGEDAGGVELEGVLVDDSDPSADLWMWECRWPLAEGTP